MFPLVKTSSRKPGKKGGKERGLESEGSVHCVLSHSGKSESEAPPAAEFCAVLPETELDLICAGKQSASRFVAAAQEVMTFRVRLQRLDVKLTRVNRDCLICCCCCCCFSLEKFDLLKRKKISERAVDPNLM